MAVASRDAGHEIVGVVSRSGEERFGPPLNWADAFPAADVMLVAVRDEAIVDVVDCLEEKSFDTPVAAHLSGFVPVTTLRPLQETGVAIGGFHPLQTLPDPERGSRALAGSYAGIEGDPLAVGLLTDLAGSLGMRPFRLRDEFRPAYHAGAAAASSFVITAIATAADLLASAHVDPSVARPLVETAIANVFEFGPGRALTGPIARGDIETVIGHLTASSEVSPEVGRQFKLMAEATAIRAGKAEEPGQWS
jgi:predicted short-subunit dehydrogenase-like oxidoreductase (DUF2520 family)